MIRALLDFQLPPVVAATIIIGSMVVGAALGTAVALWIESRRK